MKMLIVAYYSTILSEAIRSKTMGKVVQSTDLRIG